FAIARPLQTFARAFDAFRTTEAERSSIERSDLRAHARALGMGESSPGAALLDGSIGLADPNLRRSWDKPFGDPPPASGIDARRPRLTAGIFDRHAVRARTVLRVACAVVRLSPGAVLLANLIAEFAVAARNAGRARAAVD